MIAIALVIIVWAAHFGVTYGGVALACARHAPALVPWVVGGAAGVALVALVAIAVPAAVRATREQALLDFIATGLGGLALVAVAWEASVLQSVRECG